MSSAAPESETLTLDSTSLYLKAHTDLPSLPLPLPPVPSSLPQPKQIPRTRFVVDGFKHAGDFSVSYFLSHFHSDHYCGLTPSWSRGVIYCSSTTARLLVEILKVPAQFVVELPLCEPILIDGCEVYLIDANHCPGAVQFLFRVPVSEGRPEKYVHTGDFRYSGSMKSLPVLNEFIGSNAVFLDTTYCDPKFVFPTQEESIKYVVGVIQRIGDANEGGMKNVLFLVATYLIGKEKILLEISRSCKRKIHADVRKLEVLRVLGLLEGGVFTEDESESDVHVVGWNVLGETWPFFRPNFVRMKEIMEERGYSKVIGFVPTGWTYEAKKNTFPVMMKDSFEIHLVPYSEHSNYDELREYVKFLKPRSVIPTVGMDIDKIDSKQANALRKHFAAFLDVTAIKQEFLKTFNCGAKEAGENADTSFSLASNVTIKNQDVGGLHGIEYNKDVNTDNIEESIQELKDCLPSWVTHDLMLDLLRKSGNNVVDAVSEFYEHELEFHEQISANISPTSESLVSSKFKSSLFTETSLCKTEDVSLSQSFKLPAIRGPIKSLGKKKRTPQFKTNKKGKTSLSQEFNRSKQYTITKFFNKLTPLESKGDEAIASSTHSQDDDSLATHSQDDDNLVQNDITEQHKVDRFIEIVNGDESLRSHALSVLERGKWDINTALDIYYNNSSLTIIDKKVSLPDCNLSQTESLIQNNSSSQCAKLVERRMSDSGMPSPAQPRHNLHVDYVLLPPERYLPSEHACWRKGQPAPYLHLARTFEQVEKERGKIKATLMFCNMFRSLLVLSPEDVLPAVYLCVNKIAPNHMNMELNIGGSIVVAAIEDACGTSKSKTRDLYNCLGDLGDVAQQFRPIQPLFGTPAVLTIKGVFSALRKISTWLLVDAISYNYHFDEEFISAETGNGSTLRKKNIIVNLMRSCREKEIKFLVRTLVRNLRIGAMMRTILPGLAQAIVMNSDKGSVETLKEHLQRVSAAVIEAYNVLPDLDLLVPSLMEKGVMFSSTCLSMVPGIPIKPMLAKITNGAAQVLSLFQEKAFTCEYKYDGQRAQIHRLDDGSLRVFSRNGDETTARFPDLVEIIKEACVSVVGSFILDAEVVAINRKKGLKLMSFQELSSREKGSKGSVLAVDKIKVDICVFVFDVMFVNGQQLLDLPLRQRRKYLKDLFGQEKPGYFEYAKEITVESDNDAYPNNEATLARINDFLNNAHLSSCEGIMVKSLDFNAGYTPSRHSDAWLKVKRDYVEGLGDSLDLVPIGAWHGNGRKAGWYSPFLMACYNPDTEEFQSVCRVMSGFSDSFYKEMKEFFSGDKVLMKKPPYYETAEVPDTWFSPELVWEIRGADFTISPVHHAAIGVVHPSRGISVRFPRFVRSVSDKNPEECSTAADIAEMFSSQTRKMEVVTEA